MALIYNASFDSQTRILSLLDKAGNVISSCEVPSKSSSKELTLTATEDNSSVKLTKYGTLSNTFEVNKGNGWEDYAFDTVIPLNAGQSCKWRCSEHLTTQKSTRHVMFVMTGKIEASGNCLSMIQTDMTTPNMIEEYAFFGLFSGCSSLTRAPELPVPNYGLLYAYHCFQNMFNWCTSLTKAPELPYTYLVTECFKGMFWGCHNLKEVRISATRTDTDALDGWLGNVSTTGDFYCDPNATIFPTDSTSGIPSGWNRRNINLLNALTLTATADNSSVKLTKNGTLDNTFEVDTGNGWTAYEFDTVIPLNAGQSCKWRCSAHPTTQSSSNYVNFVMTGTIEASGNCNSMLSSDFEGITSLTGYNYAFMSLFISCTSLAKAPELPATVLSPSCYRRMFLGCESLVKSPELPATTLANYCYFQMFTGCKSLVKSPELPATTLADYCYYYMFTSCYKLKEVRVSATTATDALYSWLSGVSATGDFYCDPNATIFPSGESGIPANWNRHALSDYPVTP